MSSSSQYLSKYIKDRWILWLGIIVFVLYKLPALHFPFYWDESWSYEPAIKLMYRHGPSLLPNAIDTDYSRGHPLLFYFLSAAWMKIFGPSAISQHIFALTISVCLIATVYEVSLRLFNSKVALLTLAILPLQCIFFVQSTMLLPEVMVALFSVLSLYFYTSGKPLPTFLALSALLFTKESGMVMGLVLGVHATISLLNKKIELRERLSRFFPVLLAGAFIGLFFLLQKQMNGWYLFPEHVGYISYNFQSFWDKLTGCLTVVFYDNLRFQLFRLVMFLALVIAINTKQVKYLLPVATGLIIFTCLDNALPEIPQSIKLLLLIICFMVTGYQLSSWVENMNRCNRSFIQLGFYFLMVYFVFCSFNYLTGRYLITAIAISIILLSVLFDYYVAQFYNAIYVICIILILLIAQQGINTNLDRGDCGVRAFDGMQVQQDIVRYFEDNNLYTAQITVTNFQNSVHLKDPKTGFLKSEKAFVYIKAGVTDTTQYVIYDNVEPSNTYDSFKTNHSGQLVYRTAHNSLWGEIYKLK